MKLQFEPDLDYQQQAIEAVCDLFRGQEIPLGFTHRHRGTGNRLMLLDDQLWKNLNDVQHRHGVLLAETLVSGDFTVEMETGTGKTYVYLRTIFELNRRYGFTKFVIVVPSVAIKEGVYKSLQITEDHFKSLYSGQTAVYFVYDSAKLGQVRTFATSPNLQIMIMTVGAINKKDVNNLYKNNEKTGDEKPIDLIGATRPIVIVDEPQSVDGGLSGAGKAALEAMHPLCTLRYSATHVDKYHMIFRLDAVDAYERRLVKQIEVASATVEDAHNRPFVRLLSVGSGRSPITARIELDVRAAAGIERRELIVQDGRDLEQATGRAIYAGCRIGEIRTEKGREYIELRIPGGERYLELGQAWGDVDAVAVQRAMIRRTIKEHLDKERQLRPHGIKVLSLFFVDAVERYRGYDAEGRPVKGVYASIFEEEYQRLAGQAESYVAEQVHGGYFSIDKKGGWTNTAETNRASRDNAERAYHLIMKEKEKLLSFETPLQFIFSHSALKEGWDNPNVFQICALRDVRTERERRQTIGRGLRLCVNQRGQRVRGFDVNTLTIVANESYEQFAENLQKEIEAESGIHLGGRLKIANADERRVRSHPAVLVPPDRVEATTASRILFDNEKLVEQCIRALRDVLPVAGTRLQWRKAGVAIGKSGVAATEHRGASTVELGEVDFELPDLLTDLEERTRLTRRTLYRILTDSGRLGDFQRNPQGFIESAAEAIDRCKRLAGLVDGGKARVGYPV